VIHVERTEDDVPPDLAGEDSAGAKERKKALAKYNEIEADPEKDVAKDFKFEFKAYKRDGVKATLNRLFHGKCAYCETRYASTQPMDVEHWRPKGLANRGDGLPDMKPGYYWLAAEWDNLLPSCIDCNRARLQIVPPDNIEVKLGKANQFPLAEEDKRVTNHNLADQIQHESPLILHPCHDDPVEHLEFTTDAVAQPRADANGAPNARAAHSIDVFALNRSSLVFSRKELLTLIAQRKFTIERLMVIHDEVQGLPENTNALRERKERLEMLVEELLLHEIKALRALTERDRAYSMLATQFVTEFLEDVRGDLPVPI